MAAALHLICAGGAPEFRCCAAALAMSRNEVETLAGICAACRTAAKNFVRHHQMRRACSQRLERLLAIAGLPRLKYPRDYSAQDHSVTSPSRAKHYEYATMRQIDVIAEKVL